MDLLSSHCELLAFVKGIQPSNPVEAVQREAVIRRAQQVRAHYWLPVAATYPTDLRQELQASVTMIRTWIPEAFPANAAGQVHFVRAVIESIAGLAERVLIDGLPPPPKADPGHV